MSLNKYDEKPNRQKIINLKFLVSYNRDSLMEVPHRRKRHKSEANCKRCRLLPSTPLTPSSTRSVTSTDDCIPTSLAMFLASELSNLNRTSQISSCDGCPPSFHFRNPLYSSSLTPTSSFITFSRLPYCSCSSFSHSSSYSSSTPTSFLEDKCKLRLSISSSDDDMNANSPDSGFESTSSNGSPMVDYFDALKPDDSIDDSSTSSSATSLLPTPSRLCLKPPPKPEIPIAVKEIQPEISCQWKDCALSFSSYSNLHEHLCLSHVNIAEKRISCLWKNCRVYDKEARSISWLRTHVSTHTRKKRFKCILDGCEASFASQNGLARHVPSHFSEVNLPKARITPGNERKCLVKRRRIRDKKKALANTHDLMDECSVDLIVNSLVKFTQSSTSKPLICNDNQVLCKRRCTDGSVWKLLNVDQRWTTDSSASNPLNDGVLFFARPTKRSRKLKALK